MIWQKAASTIGEATLDRMLASPGLHAARSAAVRDGTWALRTLSGHAFEWVDALRGRFSAPLWDNSIIKE